MFEDGPTWCAHCFRPRGPAEWACPTCGGGFYTTEIPAGVVVELPDEDAHWTQGRLDGLTRLPPGYVGLLSGPPGEGKTTLGLEAFPHPQVLAIETSGLLAAAYCSRLDIQHGGIFDRSSPTSEDPAERLRLQDLEPGGYVLADSLAPFGHRAREALHVLMRWARDTGSQVLAIAHATKGGDVSGALALQHDVETVIWIDRKRGRSIAKTLKSRWAPKREVRFELEGVTRPAVRQYVTVEGKIGGPYELVPWPRMPGEREPQWAGALQLAERGKQILPPAPAATACQRSRLYAGGLLAPPDEPEREAFAIEHEVPFFSVADLVALQRDHEQRERELAEERRLAQEA